jgi:NTE family protein
MSQERPPRRPSALEALQRYRREVELLGDQESRPALDEQLRRDLEGSLAGGEESGRPAGPAPEAREFLREFGFDPGLALCLSGFGYKGMLFNAGALVRLNELGVLPRLDRIFSVSGGSIAAAALGVAWPRLDFGADGVASALDAQFVEPLRRLAAKTIDVTAIITGLLRRSDQLAKELEKHLLGDSTLQELPDRPRITIGATNLRTGALWRFSPAYMGDFRVGLVPRPAVPLAVAVAASTAYQPLLGPVRLSVDDSQYERATEGDLQHPPFTTDVPLVDGSVSDSLALEGAWNRYRRILVSDGGGGIRPEAADKLRGDLAFVTIRMQQLAMQQVRDLYKRQLINAFNEGAREGAYWGLRTDVANYGLPDTLPVPAAAAAALAEIPARLQAMDAQTQERLINLGYAIADAAIRRFVEPQATVPPGFPYPGAGVG